ncbi:MAG: sensor histidine kinase [Planctomycetaceae bacterium]
MIKSLRWRLQIWHAVILAVVLTLFGAYGYALQWHSRLQQVDTELDRTAGIVISRLRRGYAPFRPFSRPAVNPRDSATGPLSSNSPVERLSAKLSSEVDSKLSSSGPSASGASLPSTSPSLPVPINDADDDRGKDWDRGTGRDGRGGRGRSRNWTWTWRGVEISEDLLNPPDASNRAPIYFLIWNSRGELLEKSKWAPDVPFPNLHNESSRIPMRITRQREMEREVIHVAGFGMNVLVGRSLTQEVATQQRFLMLLIGAGVSVLMVGMLGGWWLTTRAIHPITLMARTASTISAQSLDARIDIHETDTELGQLAGVLNQTFDRLQSAFEQQVRFTADASHELRTPVSILLAQTQTALSKMRSVDDYRAALESCRRAALRMKSLTESLLALAHQDTTATAKEFQAVELSSMAGEIIALLRPLADERDISIERRGEPCSVSGNPEHLSQLLTNLLSNAIRYNRMGGKVDVTIESQDAQAVISIRDTGVGIDAADLPHVFERFFRVDKARTRDIGGSGLGLSICYAIVQAPGGEIHIDSEIDVGTTVTVKLLLA